MQVNTNNPEVARLVTEQVEALHEVPQELVNMIPATVWSTLTGTQRVELLRQHNLLDKYGSNDIKRAETAPVAQQQVQPTEVDVNIVSQHPQTPTVSMVDTEGQSALPAEVAQFQQVAQEVKREEAQQQQTVENQPVQESEAHVTQTENKPEQVQPDKERLRISEEDMQRIEAEKNVSSSRGSAPKLFGYSASDDTVNNADDRANNGSISDASTWTATLLQKLWAVFSR